MELEDSLLNKPQKIANEDLLFASLAELSKLIKSKSLRSEDLVKVVYEHIEIHNKKINAVIEIRPIEELLHEAKKLDLLLENGSYLGVLHGIPVTVKECFNVKGLRSTNGNPFLLKNFAKEDAFLVKQMKNSGAIILGKTNLPLFSIDWISSTMWSGRTNNPYDLSRGPGGSSGGSAASLASGFTPIELGSDAGGSIRVPAHFCGVCGLRPSEGLLSNDGHMTGPGYVKGLRYVTVPGPMARNISDLKLVFDVLWNKEHFLSQLVPIDIDQFDVQVNRPLKIAYSSTINNVEIDFEYKKEFDSFLEKLRLEGHDVVEAQPAIDFKKSYRSWSAIMGFEFGSNMPQLPLRSLFMYAFTYLKYRDHIWATGMRKSISGDIRNYAKALEYRDEASMAYNNFIANYDVWLTPVASDCAFLHQRTGKPFKINGKKVGYTEAIGTFNFNSALTQHPICVIPIGKIKNHMPVGIQIHAMKWHDKGLLNIAEHFEQLTEGFQIPQMFK